MYKILDTKQTTELYLLRHGWFSPEFTLTDGADEYGKMYYKGILRRNATVNTSSGTIKFYRDGFFSRTILIADENGVEIGKTEREWFSRKRQLTLRTGFQAEFSRPQFFSRQYVWDSVGYGRILHIKGSPFNLKSIVYIDQSMAPQAVIPLLIFLGGHLIILRRRRKAAH